MSNERVSIERVGNGYQVGIGRDDQLLSAQHVFVFQDKGCVTSGRDFQPTEATLFGWLDRHFSDNPAPTQGGV